MTQTRGRSSRSKSGILWSATLLGLFSISPEESRSQEVQFLDVTAKVGIDFVHTNGASGEKFAVETMCAGCGLFDYDGDGDLDVYLTNGAPLPGFQMAQTPVNRLYRNDGEAAGWTFSDVTNSSGVGDPGYGMGCAVGDYDNDGNLDLYVTNFGANVLYRNNGDGTFANRTREAGVGNDRWSTSAAFFDADNNGNLDLYVVNYVDFRLEDNRLCNAPDGSKAYCHPDVYPGVADVLYRNNGDGTFIDIAREAGVYQPEGKGLGVICTDYDRDGDLDIYVANDTMENYLYANSGEGTFEEVGLLSGTAFNEMGQSEASMGVDFADVDGDGFSDILIGHLDMETNTLYKNGGNGTFTDVTVTVGMGAPSLLRVTFGLVFLDADNDGDVDAFAANGHVQDNIELMSDVVTYKQLNQLFENVGGGRFEDASARFGPGLDILKASRGLAAGDFDNDGDVDLLVANIAERPELLRNNGGNRNNWLSVKLIGGARKVSNLNAKREPRNSKRFFSNRDGIGARVTVVSGDLRQVKELHSAYSYLSAGDFGIHFGLGNRSSVDLVEIQWPAGGVDRIEAVAVNQLLVVVEGKGQK